MQETWSWYRLVMLASTYIGLKSLTFCSSINTSCCWCVCIKNSSQQFILDPSLHVFVNAMVSSIFLCLCILFSLCRLYAKSGLFMFSMFLVPNFQRPVGLAYIQTVKCFAFNLYTPPVFFMLCGDLLFRWLYKMLAALKAMFKLVYLNRLVTLHTSGLWIVKLIHFFFVFVQMSFWFCVIVCLSGCE